MVLLLKCFRYYVWDDMLACDGSYLIVAVCLRFICGWLLYDTWLCNGVVVCWLVGWFMVVWFGYWGFKLFSLVGVNIMVDLFGCVLFCV